MVDEWELCNFTEIEMVNMKSHNLVTYEKLLLTSKQRQASKISTSDANQAYELL